MSDKEQAAVVDMLWLAKGEEDPHPRYVELKREDLSAPHLSDDELAYKMAMLSTISEEADMRQMLASHRTGGNYISKGIMGEVAKDRIRWLSRRVAVLEGRYPGVTPDTPKLKQLHELCAEKKANLEIWYEHEKGGWASNWTEGHWVLDVLVDHLIKDLTEIDPELVIAADEPKGPVFPIDSPDAYQEALARARWSAHTRHLYSSLDLPLDASFDFVVRRVKERAPSIDLALIGMALKPGNCVATIRWHLFVNMVKTLAKHGCYVPFDGDVVENRVRNDRIEGQVVVQSRYHRTPMDVRYPVGVVGVELK